MRVIPGDHWVQGLSGLSEFEFFREFSLMKIVRVENCRQRSPRKPSLNRSALNLDGDFMLAILRMKMGRGMVSVVQSDDDPKEATDFRHC